MGRHSSCTAFLNDPQVVMSCSPVAMDPLDSLSLFGQPLLLLPSHSNALERVGVDNATILESLEPDSQLEGG